MLHHPNDYGYAIFPINGGKCCPDAKFAVVDMEGDEDGLFLECATAEEAERELLAHLEFVVSDGH